MHLALLVDEGGLAARFVVETHVHADFICGHGERGLEAEG
jgi:hypothetical protein